MNDTRIGSHNPSIKAKLRTFRAEGLDVELFAVSPADAAAEAFSNQDNQVYFGKGQIALREGAWGISNGTPRTVLEQGRATGC
jgi:hypothetical protein